MRPGIKNANIILLSVAGLNSTEYDNADEKGDNNNPPFIVIPIILKPISDFFLLLPFPTPADNSV